MRLPGGELAVVDLGKLRDYVLNPIHPRGKHKARVFASALGIRQEDAEFLRDRLLEAVLGNEVVPGDSDQYGERYILDFECIRGNQRAIIRSGWIVLNEENYPRLVTCFVLSD